MSKNLSHSSKQPLAFPNTFVVANITTHYFIKKSDTMKANPIILLLLFTCCASWLGSQVYDEYYFKLPAELRDIAPVAVTTNSDGATIFTGTYSKVVNNKFYHYPFICKVDVTGSMQWFKGYWHFNEELPEVDLIPTTIVTTYPDEGIVVAGNVYREGNMEDAFVFKVSPDGYYEYTKFYSCEEVRDDDFYITCEYFKVNHITSTLTGGIVLGGSIKMDVGTITNGIVVKLDHWGERIPGFTKPIKHPDYQENEVINVQRLTGNEYVALMHVSEPTSPTSWQERPCVVRLDNQFNIVWSKEIYRNEYSDSFTPSDMLVTDEQRIMILGDWFDKIMLTALTSAGNELWTKSYTTSDIESNFNAYSPKFHKDSFEDFYIARKAYNSTSTAYHTTVVKTTALGNVIWANTYSNSEEDGHFEDITVINNGPFLYPPEDVVFIGSYLDQVPSGWWGYGWNVRLRTGDGSTECTYEAISASSELEIFTAINFSPSTFDVIPTYSYHSVTAQDIATEMFKCNIFWVPTAQNGATNASEKMDEPTFSIAPNPNRGDFTLQLSFPDSAQEVVVEIFDASGKRIDLQTLAAEYQTLDYSNFAPGLYLISLTQGQYRATKKLIVH